jgi:uncharacterized membrane protein YgcG
VSSNEFTQEMESLNAQIEQFTQAVVKLENEQRVIETELDEYAIEQQNVSLLEQACNALDQLSDMGAEDLFWGELSGKIDHKAHNKQVRSRIAELLSKTDSLNRKKEELQSQINQHMSVLDALFEEVEHAQARETRRVEEFTIVREETKRPYRAALMPWSVNAEDEKLFRKTILAALCCCLLLGSLISLVSVPIPDRTLEPVKIPERMAMLLKEEAPPAPPKPTQVKEPEQPPEPEVAKKTEEKKVTEPKQAVTKKAEKAQPPGTGKKGQPTKPNVGVLAFKSSFDDMLDEVPVASLKNAKVKNINGKIPGEARASRSLVSTQAKGGGSSGISNFGVSRNLGGGGTGGSGGSGKIGGVATGRVESAMAGMTEQAGRPLSDGAIASRTDEEIQIIFDRYKATLYRIYNKELRKDPTLKGRINLRLTIEPDGKVSMCESESSDLKSIELIAMVVSKVKRINFGDKEGVPQITIRYPIDFLPAG